MKTKLFIAAAATAGAALFSGTASAQASCWDSASPDYWGPGCGGSVQQPHVQSLRQQILTQQGYGYVNPGVPLAMDGRYAWVDPRSGRIYNRGTRHDRDGDGIRNNRDRYPDDPRYR